MFLSGSPGPMELLVIFAVVLVLFGPRKLPEIARSIGRMLHELRKASDEFRSHVMAIDAAEDQSIDQDTKPIADSETNDETVDDSDDAGKAV
jgi:TatA/E family protein of Tat protein translocase